MKAAVDLFLSFGGMLALTYCGLRLFAVDPPLGFAAFVFATTVAARAVLKD